MQHHPNKIQGGDVAVRLVELGGRSGSVAGVPAGIWMGRIYGCVHMTPKGEHMETSQPGGAAKVSMDEAGNG